MTTKTLSTYVAAGYTLARKFDELIITSTGGVGGTGVTARASAIIDNSGTVNASGFSTGVSLLAGGLVINERGGAITGSIGIDMRAAGNVFNYGVIRSSSGYRPAIYLENGGTVTNGGYSNRAALIANGAVYIKGGAGAVLNFATIAGAGSNCWAAAVSSTAAAAIRRRRSRATASWWAAPRARSPTMD